MNDDITEMLIETWSVHNRIHLYLLESIPEESMSATMGGRGRTVFDLFAHVHNVRLMWLKPAAPDLLEGLEKIEPKTSATRSQLAAALTASSIAIEALLRRSFAAGAKVKGFKPHAPAFLGYLISHESHHRGQIEWALKSSGAPLSDKVSYGLWEWGSR
jgi:uncharacterized damage-inducible protein DinB